jgi:phosphonate transport system permease protein
VANEAIAKNGDPGHRPVRRWPTRHGALILLAIGAYAICVDLAEVDLHRLWVGLPKLAHWLGRAWPPDLTDLGLLLFRAAETVAMATVGTSLGIVIAAPICLYAARNVTPSALLYYPARWLLNLLRGIDSFVFALLFVAAVGLGPFAGVLGIGLHSAGSIAKLWSETMEGMVPGPLEAIAMTGASRFKLIVYGVVPELLPMLLSTSLYIWEFNIRSSTVLGLVGAGGIGQDLKNSVDLLDFSSVLTIILIILAMVTAIDQTSAWLRKRMT